MASETAPRKEIDVHMPVKIKPTSDRKLYLFTVHGKSRSVCHRSLFIFDVYGPVRQHVLWVVEWKWFERFILFLIFYSSTLLALWDSRHPNAWLNKLADWCDPVLTVCFTMECLMKITAWGLCFEKNSYLRSAWNWLDLIVVATGWIALLPSVGFNTRFLLVFKVLRPLRSLTVMPQMRLLVNTVLLSMKRLGQFCIMVVFLFSVFSIIGLNFWAGVSYRQCRKTKDPVWDSTLQCWNWDVPSSASGRFCGGRYMCENGYKCGSIFSEETQESLRPNFGSATWKPGRVPGEGAPWCASTLNTWDGADFNFHFTHFDHMLGALLVIFQSMTMEGWVDLMYLLQDGDSDIVASIYFVLMVSATAFFLLNAALAIVTETFEEAMGHESDEEDDANGENDQDNERWAAPRDKSNAIADGTRRISPTAPGVAPEVIIKQPDGEATQQNRKASKLRNDGVKIDEVQDFSSVECLSEEGDVHSETAVTIESGCTKPPSLTPRSVKSESDDLAGDASKGLLSAITTSSYDTDAAEDDANFMGDQDWDQEPWIDSFAVRSFRGVASHDFFVNCVMFFILLNVITMCLDTYPPPPAAMQQFLNICNYVFAIVFSVEMVILLVALGPWLYWTQVMTAFDGIVVIAGWIEISMSGGGGAVRAFRGLRLLRIFKLAKKWTSFRVILKAMIGTVWSLGNLGILLLIMIFIFTLMGRDFFALEFHFDDDGKRMSDAGKTTCYGEEDNYSCVPRAHFDTFLWAFVTVFQILTGENWNAIMYDGMKANGLYVMYFVLVMVFGQFIMLSLFLAVLMSKFEESRELSMKVEEKRKKSLAKISKVSNHSDNVFGRAWTVAFSVRHSLRMNKASISTTPTVESEEETEAPAVRTVPTDQEPVRQLEISSVEMDVDGKPYSGSCEETGGDECKSPADSVKQHSGSTPEIEDAEDVLPAAPRRGLHGEKAVLHDMMAKRIKSGEIPPVERPNGGWQWPYHYACCLLPPDNRFRESCCQLVERKIFDQAILVCICLASLAMALDSPLADPDGILPVILYWMGAVFTVIFTIEMFLKMIAYGCFCGFSRERPAYWQQPWNVLDGLVVIFSVVDLAMQGKGALSSFKTLRIVRALRPLRVVARFENLRLVVQTLFSSVPALANVLIVGVLVFLIFALFFLSYFKGKFYACMTVSDGELSEFTFDKNVSFFWNAAGTIPMSMFFLNSSLVHLTSAQAGRVKQEQPNPVCVDSTTGVVSALGTMSQHRNGRWTFNNVACSGSGQILTARTVRDAPICVGRCSPSRGKDDKRPAQCPAPPERVQELPSFCSGAYGGLSLTDALASQSVSSTIADLDERKGYDYYASITRRHIMFCGGSTSTSSAYPGCREKYCPDGCPEPPCDDRRKKCQRDCENHPIYCSDSCKDNKEGSQDCKLCREQCEAQCQCSEYCGGFVKDAANCVEQGGRWDQAISQSFDNILSSFLTLVEISTTEGWVDVMYQAVDAVDPMMQPVRDNSELWSLAFMFFIFVSFFFYINLCVGVIVDNYGALKDQPAITKEQADWISTHKSLHKRHHFFGLTNLNKLPKMQVLVFRIITHHYFENFIMFCIVGNTLCMALKQFPSPSTAYEDVRQVVNRVFGAIFFLEMLIKLFALRRNYFKESWNIFDFFCVMSTIVGIIVQQVSDIEMASAMSAIRAFRIARLFRLVRFLRGLNRMFTALLLSLPKLINVGAILLLFFFLFSVLGVQLFAKNKFYGPHDLHANFRDPGRAFLTLMRSVTGEGWNEMMHALARNLDFFALSLGEVCISDDLYTVDGDTYPVLNRKCLIDQPSGCGKDFSYIYFVIFTFIMSMVMVNLMIAVILEAFSDSSSNDLLQVIDTCIKIWPDYDYDLDLIISLSDTFSFINKVSRSHGVNLSGEDQATAAGQYAPEQQIFVAHKASQMGAERSQLKVANVPMNIANLCDVKVLPDGRVHFLYAVRMAVAVTLAGNDTSVLKEFEEAEKNDPRLAHLRNLQVRRCVTADTAMQAVPLKELVGAAKIQSSFRAMRILKKKLRDSRDRIAERSAAMATMDNSHACDDATVTVLNLEDPGSRGGQSQTPDGLVPREAG